MDLLLITKEISEAKMYRTSRQFGVFDGRDIADLLYLQTLSVYMLSRDNQAETQARDYAKQTAQYGTYALFRSFATDLYMLCYQALHPDNDYVQLSDTVASKKFLNNLNFNARQHLTFMRRIASADADSNIAGPYFYRLESQLRISDTRYKQWRRTITNWSTAREHDKDRVKNLIVREMRRLGKGGARASELVALTQNTMSTSQRKSSQKKSPIDTEKPSTAKRIAGTAAGALAGRYAADKLNKMNNKTAKNIGTGIGAVAGYWASGKRKQK